MTLALTILAAPFAMLVFVALGYRRKWIAAEQRGDTAEQIACDALDAKRAAMAERDYWQTACRRSYGMDSRIRDASPEKVRRIMRDIYTVPGKPSPVAFRLEANTDAGVAQQLIAKVRE